MKEDVWPTALKLEPDVEGCRRFVDEARAMLSKAWRNPKQLGEGSAICDEATRLHIVIRSHCTPQEGDTDEAAEARSLFLEALRLSWSAVWRARDYTLQGVAKRLKAADPSSDMLENLVQYLQWVIPHGDQRWFPLHFPLHDADGREIPSPRHQPSRSYLTSEHPALYEGAIVRDRAGAGGMPTQLPLRWAWIRPDALPQRDPPWELQDCFSESGIPAPKSPPQGAPDLRGSIFLPRVNLTHWPANTFALLEGARFEGGVELRSAGRSEAAAFPASVETGPRLLVHGAPSGPAPEFASCFGIRELFCTGEFSEGVVLNRLRHGLVFELRAPDGNAVKRVVATNTRFREITIRAGEIQELTLSGECSGKFSLGRVIKSATLEDFSIGGRADFTKTQWINKPVFKKLRIGREGMADFDGVEFHNGADFSQAQFGGYANFRHGQFTGPMTFDAAAFLAGCSFEGGSGDRDTFDEVSFLGASFDVEADFDNRHFEDTTNFGGSRFNCAPSFHGSQLHSNTSFGNARFQWPRLAWFSRILRGIAYRLDRRSKSAHEVVADNHRLELVETRFRVLTALARQSHSPGLAFRFHREELMSRHMRTADPKVPRWDAIAGWFYGLWSDYGGSFARPLAWFVAAWILFTAAYWSLSTLPGQKIQAAFHQSASIQLRPFSNLDPALGRAATEAWRAGPSGSICSQENVPTVRVGEYCFALDLTMKRDSAFHFLAGTQSVIAVVLLFLMALGLRRQFQLN